LGYAPGTKERAELKKACETLRASSPQEVPLVVGGKQVSFQQQKKIYHVYLLLTTTNNRLKLDKRCAN
jgi:hypothetical protein